MPQPEGAGGARPSNCARSSLFFRLAPGPQRLVIRGHSAAQPVELTVDLKSLADLHLKSGTALAAAAPRFGAQGPWIFRPCRIPR